MGANALDRATLQRLHRLPRNMAKAQDDAAFRAALAAKRAIQRQTGYTARLRNVGKSGARLNVRVDVKPGQGGRRATVIVRAVGPFQLVERDTRAHVILPRGVGRAQGRTKAARRQAKQDLYDALFGGRVGSAAKPLHTPYGPRYRVNHPGTQGRHPFERGVERALPEMRRVLGSTIRTALTSSRFD